MPKSLDTKQRIAALCADRKLTPRQTRFVLALVEHRNASAAYRAAYDVKAGASARAVTEEAHRLVRHPKVAPIVHELRSAMVDSVIVDVGITKAMIMAELAKMGFSNLADYGYIDEHGQFVVDLSGCTRDQLAAIQEVTTEVVMEGKGEDARRIIRTKLKLHGKRQPLVDMGKEIGMFVDRKRIDNNVVPPEVQARRDAARRA